MQSLIISPLRIFDFQYDATEKNNIILDRCRTIKSETFTLHKHLILYILLNFNWTNVLKCSSKWDYLTTIMLTISLYIYIYFALSPSPTGELAQQVR